MIDRQTYRSDRVSEMNKTSVDPTDCKANNKMKRNTGIQIEADNSIGCRKNNAKKSRKQL